MYKRKIYSLLFLILGLLTGLVAKAQGTVQPTLTDDNEVCIFLVSPDANAKYTFWGYGGDYQDENKTWPGDSFTLLGRQIDGAYLYKWERPADATGIPQKFTICKNGSADANKIYADKNYVNHGVFLEMKKTGVSDVVAEDPDQKVTKVATGNADDPLAVLKNADEHSIFFETPSKNDYFVWPYNGALGGEHFTASGSWPGDKMELLGTLASGNYLYKWTQTVNVTDMPASMIICRANGETKIYGDGPYVNHGYFKETIISEANMSTIMQIGKAYPASSDAGSALDPLAQLDDPQEISFFLESPEENATYYAWLYDGAHDDGYFTENDKFPGDKLIKVGKLSNGHYLYKWIQNHVTEVPTKLIICKNGSSDADKIYADEDFNNHGYYVESTDADNKTVAKYTDVVTRVSDGSSSTSRTTYGKRVIYEMNVGSFTQEGTFKSAKAMLNNLKYLGVDVVWLMPIYERGSSNSPYAVKNFKAVNPNYGILADLKDFVNTAHSLNMDVWLDFVPNHAATDNIWLDPNGGDYHPEYFTGYNKDNPSSTAGFVHPNNYNDVWQLDYTTEVPDPEGGVYNLAGRAMGNCLQYWVEQADVDGFRFDYVSSPTIPNVFWNAVTNKLKSIKPSLQFLAETDFTDKNNAANPANFQYDYAWNFNEKLRAFGTSSVTYADDNSSDPKDLAHITKNFLTATNDVNVDRMVYLTNHDVNWNFDKKTMKDIWGDNRYAMTVYQFTMPGMPLIYNGQEQDGTVALNYFDDTKIDWDGTKDYNMYGLISELSYLKHSNNAINDGNNASLRGETRILNTYEHTVLAYERSKGDKHVIVVLNLSDGVKSTTILGATRGSWKLVLKGSNIGLDNLDDDVTIGDNWLLNDIPAHGYEVFTYTGERQNDEAGIYFVTDDSWDNPTKHKMVYAYSDDNNDYYKFEIKGTDFDNLNANGGQLYFKFQEYYDFLNLGTICKTDQMFGAGNVAAEFKDGGAKEFAFKKDVENADNAFSINNEGMDVVSKYIITFARSKANPDEGKVSLEVIKVGQYQDGYYLLTPLNINSRTKAEEYQWHFKDSYEDKDAVSDRYIANLNETKCNLCSYTIDASQFDSYIPADRKSGNAIQFRIRQLQDQNDNVGDICPKKDDADNDASTFNASKGDKVYGDAHWDAYNDNDAYFKIVYQPDVAKYIIQMWRTSEESDGETRVRVYYVRKFNYQGSSIEDVTASGEDVYLYNVDAQKFLYVGNRWGTMASLLYDDLGTRLNISEGLTDINPDYKLIKTRLNAVTTVPNGHMLGIDDFSYDAKSKNSEINLDEGYIFCDRDNGNTWLFEKADTVNYANTYTLRLYNKKDGRYHFMLADHSDGTDAEAKAINTRVKYIAQKITSVTLADLNNSNLKGNAEIRDNSRIAYIGSNQGYVTYTYNAPKAGNYNVSVSYMTNQNRKLKLTVDGKDYSLDAASTGSFTNANTAETLNFNVHMSEGKNTIEIGHQAEAAPNISKFSVAMTRPDNLAYARWQLVTYSDLVKKLKNENSELYGGTTADATFLLRDQGFTRNIEKKDSWNTDNGTVVNNQRSTVDFIKNAIGDVPNEGMYWNARITGKGKVYQDVDVPMYGVYQFDAFGFYKGSPTQMFYQYATDFDANGNVTAWSDVLGNTPLKNDENKTYNGRNTDITIGKLFYDESVLDDNPAYKNTQFIYVPQDAKTYNGSYRIRIGFNKTANATTDYTAVDDVHLHYTGKAPFILYDNWTENEKNTAMKNEQRENVPVWIKRKFWPGVWNTLVLPVSVSTTTLRAIFGDGVEVATPYGLDDDDPYLIKFTPVHLTSGSNAIEAGRYYIVKPNKLIGTTHVMDLRPNGDNTYTPIEQTVDEGDNDTKFYNLGTHNLKNLSTTVDALDVNTFSFNAASKNDTTNHNTIRIVGSYHKITVEPHSYVFTSKGVMVHLANSTPSMGGFRFYIEDVDKKPATGQAKYDFTMGSIDDDLDALLSSFNKNAGEATGIKGVSNADDANARYGNGDVYDLSGRRVAVDGKTDNLPAGVYIINGKKYIINK